MKKSWIVLLLLFLSGTALAASTPTIDATAVDQHTDLSVAYLAQIFGTVGNVLQGTTGQMLGKLMGCFSLGILAVMVLWIIGTTLLTTLRFTTEGSFMNQNLKGHLIILRIVIGIVFIIPSSTTGYSLLQDVLMKTVIEGVKLGDQVWSYGLGYISDGGRIWAMPDNTQGVSVSLTNDASVGVGMNGDGVLGSPAVSVNPSSQNLKQLGMAQRIFASEVCMVASTIDSQQNANLNADPSDNSGITVSSTAGTSSFNYYEDDTYNSLFFPGGKDVLPPTTNNPALYGCGYVSWDQLPGTTLSSSDYNSNTTTPACHARGTQGSDGAHCQYARLAVVSMADDLMSAAQKEACALNKNPSVPACNGMSGTTSDVQSDVQNALFNAAINFANNIGPLMNSQSQDSQSEAYSFIQQAQDWGWFSAGRFYWDLTHVESTTQSAGVLNNYTSHHVQGSFNPSYDPNNPSGLGDIMSPHEDSGTTSGYQSVNAVKTTVDGFLTLVGNGTSGITYQVINQILNYAAASAQGNVTGSTGYDGGSTFGLAILNFLLPIVSDFTRLVIIFQNTAAQGGMGYDPIVFMHNLGVICLDISGDIWFAPIGSIFTIMLFTVICNSEYDASTPVKQVIDWIKPFFLMLAVAFMTVGAILTVYVPLYPYMVYTFSQIGWIISVLELMVAAPIIALGITNSQGHDIFGRAEPAIMMTVSVFLGPALRVIGLIAGFILSYVFFKILIWGFAGVSYDLFSSHFNGYGSGDVEQSASHAMSTVTNSDISSDVTPLGTSALNRLLILPIFLLVFAFMTWEVIIYCYKPIYMLGKVIDFIGGRYDAQQVESALHSIQSGTSGSAGKLGSALEQTKGIPMKGTKDWKKSQGVSVSES